MKKLLLILATIGSVSAISSTGFAFKGYGPSIVSMGPQIGMFGRGFGSY